MSIKKVLVLGICCLIIIPMMAIPFIMSFVYQKDLEQKIMHASQQDLSLIASNLQFMSTAMIAASNLISNDQDIIEVLSKPDPITKLEKFFNYRAIESRISSISSSALVPYNTDVLILGNNDDVYSIRHLNALSKAIKTIRNEKMDEINMLGYYVMWVTPVDFISFGLDNSFAIIKNIKDPASSKNLGIVVVNLYIDKNIERLFQSFLEQPFFQLLLLNAQNEVIYPYTTLDLTDLNYDRISGSQGYFTQHLGGDKVIVDYFNVPRTEWKLIKLSSYSEAMSGVITLRNHVIILTGVFLIVLIILAIAFSNKIASPLHELGLLMSQLPGGDFRIRMKEYPGKSEIADLSKNFNIMVNKMEELYIQLEHSYRLRESFRLEALRAQINPHFLFNTLNSIKWMAANQGNIDVCKMLSSLGHLLQYTLTSNEEMMSVEKELSCISDYIDIQKMRFGDRFGFMTDIPDELMEFQIPIFIFQPIVENCIIHAFEDTESNGMITIRARIIDEIVEFSICDNGKGMGSFISLDQLGYTSKGRFNKIGIKNVDDRIKIIYGEQFGIRVESNLNQGTIVFMTFPYPKAGSEVKS